MSKSERQNRLVRPIARRARLNCLDFFFSSSGVAAVQLPNIALPRRSVKGYLRMLHAVRKCFFTPTRHFFEIAVFARKIWGYAQVSASLPARGARSRKAARAGFGLIHRISNGRRRDPSPGQ
jgi:hypothetical protein